MAVAAAAGLLLVVAVIMPAEYGRDPLGTGRLLGLESMTAEPTRTIEITDVIGGNETVSEAEIPDFGDPVPLPNPAVHQDEAELRRTMTMEVSIGAFEETEIKTVTDVIGGNETVSEAEIPDSGDPVPLPNPAVHQDEAELRRTMTMEVSIGAFEETEIKTVLGEAKVILYSWSVDRGDIYSDFHGHAPEFGPGFFVRYEEHQEGSGNDGSLVAPFAGEHGWYWLNYNEYPVVVTLTVEGYFDDIIDYGIF